MLRSLAADTRVWEDVSASFTTTGWWTPKRVCWMMLHSHWAHHINNATWYAYMRRTAAAINSVKGKQGHRSFEFSERSKNSRKGRETVMGQLRRGHQSQTQILGWGCDLYKPWIKSEFVLKYSQNFRDEFPSIRFILRTSQGLEFILITLSLIEHCTYSYKMGNQNLPNIDRGPMIRGVNGFLIGISFLAVLIRFVSRKLSKAGLGWDDWLCLAALVSIARKRPPSVCWFLWARCHRDECAACYWYALAGTLNPCPLIMLAEKF